MKTIFICIDWFSPAYKGGGPIVSISNLIKSFNKGIQYKIICSNYDLGNEPLIGISCDTWTNYNEFTKVWYASNNFDVISLLKSEIKKSSTSLLYINGIYSFYYNFIPILFTSCQKIICPRGMLHPEALAKKRIKKYIYLYILKLLWVKNHSTFHATTIEEEEYIKRVFGRNAKVVTAGNFPKKFLIQSPLHKDVKYLKLVSISLISPMKNHLNILQALLNSTGRIEYDIYGPIKDQSYWNLCLNKIKELPSNVLVKYHSGIQPEEVENVLMKSHVFIQPSESENFGHSIYEALSAGKPVITSTRTPWNNLQELNAGINVPSTDIKGITTAINYFSQMDDTEYKKWVSSASEYSEKAIDMKELVKKYEQLFSV